MNQLRFVLEHFVARHKIEAIAIEAFAMPVAMRFLRISNHFASGIKRQTLLPNPDSRNHRCDHSPDILSVQYTSLKAIGPLQAFRPFGLRPR